MEHTPDSKPATQERAVITEGSSTETIIHCGPWSITSAVKNLLAVIPYEHETDKTSLKKNYTLTAVTRGKVEQGVQETIDVTLYTKTIPWAFATEAERTRVVEHISKNIIVEKNKDAQRAHERIEINETNPLTITLTVSE